MISLNAAPVPAERPAPEQRRGTMDARKRYVGQRARRCNDDRLMSVAGNRPPIGARPGLRNAGQLHGHVSVTLVVNVETQHRATVGY